MKRTFLSLVSMAFICAMTLTSCDEIMSAIDNPVDSYLQVDGPELYVAEGSSIEVACATISDGDVTFTVADAKVAKVEKVEPHMAKVTGLKVGETDVIVKLAATEYYKAAEAKVKIIVKPTYSLKDAVVAGAKLKIGYKFNGKDCLFAYEYDADKKVFNELEENSVPQEITDLYEVSMIYNGDDKITQKLISKENGAVVPLVLNLYTGGSFDRVFRLANEMKSVQVNGYEMLPYTEESVTPIQSLTAAGLPGNMNTGDKGSFAVTDVTPQNATNQVIKYSSSNTAVMTIDANGNFEAVGAGEATLKAEATDGSGKYVEQTITVDLPKATVTTAPTAKTGIKAGENAAIINAGVTSDGTMMYKVTTTDTKPTSTFGFSATVPTAQSLAAGTCYVWYYVKADATHADSEIAGPVQVTIASAIISTKDVSETFTASGANGVKTITGTYFKVSCFKFVYGWRVGYDGNTITISSPDGLNLSQVVFTVNNQPNMSGRNKSHLQVDHGTLTVTGTSQGSTITISGINSPSVTLSAPSATNTNEMWTISQAVVNGKGDASK